MRCALVTGVHTCALPSSGARIGSRGQQLPQFRTVGEFEMPLGQMAPAQLYAHMARLHMGMFGTKSEHFGKIAVTVREHATMNDNALMTEPLTLEIGRASCRERVCQ